MNKKRTIIMLLQFLLVIASVGGIVYYMNSQTKTTEVFVYARNFTDSNQILVDADVKAVTIPKIAVTSGFATDKESIVGQYVQAGVQAGQYVYTEQLTETGAKDVFETLDLTEYRKISLPIDMIEGLSGNIRRGDQIDLVFTGKSQKQAEDLYTTNEFTYSSTFLQEVLVYSVNTSDGFKFEEYSDMPEGALVDENGEAIKQSKLGIITLAVTLPQAEEIYARRNVGNISFVGRFGDSENVETLGYAIGDYGSVFSGEASIELSDIEVFRGNAPAVEAPAPVVIEEPTTEPSGDE